MQLGNRGNNQRGGGTWLEWEKKYILMFYKERDWMDKNSDWIKT